MDTGGECKFCGLHEIFRESLTTPTATFPENLNGLLFRSILWICVQNESSQLYPFLRLIGGTKNWAIPVYVHAAFSPELFTDFCSDGPCEYVPTKFEVRSFAHSWDNSDWNLRRVANLQSRERGFGMVPSKRALVISYRPSIQIITL